MSIYNELETLIAEREPDSLMRSSGPASEQEICELTSLINDIPESLIELLRWQNGSPSELWLGDGFWFLLSTLQIAELYASWRIKRPYRFTDKAGESVNFDQWPQNWIPFATWNGDVFLILRNEPHHNSNIVLAVDFEAGLVRVISSSLHKFFDLVLHKIRNNESLDVDELIE